MLTLAYLAEGLTPVLMAQHMYLVVGLVIMAVGVEQYVIRHHLILLRLEEQELRDIVALEGKGRTTEVQVVLAPAVVEVVVAEETHTLYVVVLTSTLVVLEEVLA